MIKDHLGHEYDSIIDMCRAYNIDYNIYRDRTKDGWSIEKALTTPIRKINNGVKTTDHLGNEYNSISDMCKAYNIDRCTYNNRTRSGWSKEKALTTPVKPKNAASGIISIDHLGNVYDSISDMCKAHNVKYSIYRDRIKAGWSIEKALTTPVRRKLINTLVVTDHLGNEFKNISDMCNYYNINISTYSNRIHNDWTLKDALTIPVRGKRDLGNVANTNKSTNKQPETHYDIDHTLASNEKGVLLPKANNMSKKYKKIKKEDDSNIEDISIIDSEDTSTQIRKTDIYAEIMNDASISSSTRLYILFKLCEKTICHNVGMHLYYALLDWKEHNINNIFVPEKYKKYL